MKELEKMKIENGIQYILVGDYYIPDLTIREEKRPIGKYGRMHREFLKEHKSFLFQQLVLDGTLWTYLADIEEQAHNRLEYIMEQMKTAEGITEQLKESNQMLWVQSINSIHNRAEESVLQELIYQL